MKRTRSASAFTLIELLIVVSLIALLIGLLLPALASARRSAQATKCLAQTRAIAIAMQLYAHDDRNEFYPTARMGAMAPPTMSWIHLTRPYIDDLDAYRCPTDPSHNWDTAPEPRQTSYAINAYFTPNHPPYWGVKAAQVRDPSQTVIGAELIEDVTTDHFMPMFWGDPPAVTTSPMMQTMQWDSATQLPKTIRHTRHQGDVANYVFTDGHAAAHPFGDTWQQAGGSPPAVDWYDVGR